MAEYEIEKAIAAQIAGEQALSSSRMNWNLTFQGFMMAAFALVASAEFTAPTRDLLELVICLAGLVVGLATYFGVRAAQRQRDYLKAHWKAAVPENSAFPRPFSDAQGSAMGRRPALMICYTIIAMWGVLLLLVLLAAATALPAIG